MFFVKITTIDNLDFVLNLERVTLLSRTSRIVDGITKDFTSVHYDMGEGTVTSFTLDCTLEQFLDYIQYVFNCPGNPHTLVDHLQPPTPVKKSDIETLARMNAILSEANKKVRRRKEAEEHLRNILTNSSPQEIELDKYDASPRNSLPISGIRRKTQPTVDHEFFQERLNEPPFHPGDTVEVIDAQHSQFGGIGVVHHDQKLRTAPSLVVVRLAGLNTHSHYNFRKDQIQHSPYSPQEPDSCNGNGKAQSMGE